MKQVADFYAEMDPFASTPTYASRVHGLGGREPSPDGAYVFQTTPLIAPAGAITISVAFAGLTASRGTLLIEIFKADGAERRQIELRTVSLSDLAAKGGTEQFSLAKDHRDAYSLAGHIYDDADAAADGLTITLSVSAFEPNKKREYGMSRVARLAGVDLPRFEHPVSQTFSREQLKEGAFRAACKTLELAATAEAWPAAYILHALLHQMSSVSGHRGIGVGPSAGLIGRALTSMGATVVESATFDPAEWPAGSDLDFAYLDVDLQVEPAFHLFIKACCLIERLKIGGVLVMVFPFEHGRMPQDACSVPKRGDIEIIALKMLAGGHSVAQLKFRTAAGLPSPGTRSPFSMIVHRLE